MSTRARIDVRDVTEIAKLKGAWRRMRPLLRKPRVHDFYLAFDPLDWAPFEYALEEELLALRRTVLAGTYRVAEPYVLRGAKARGLSRPMTFLGPKDTILYTSIVSHASADLMSRMPPWAVFGRRGELQGDSAEASESGWFRAWLKRKAQLWTITESHEYLVETDISNFFPSVHLDAAADHLMAHSRLGVDVIRLLTHLLRGVSPQIHYQASPVVGLPQEFFDNSRTIAHSFLQPLDEVFESEGRESRYSRYMDDVVVGVDSRPEGLEAVARAQGALESLGLYPNASKTRIIAASEFVRDYMKKENDYLGDLGDDLDSGRAIDEDEFRRSLREHLAIKSQRKVWEQVLRRYYTIARRLRDPYLIDCAASHLEQAPASIRWILDYRSTWHLSRKRIEQVREGVSSVERLYDDVLIAAMYYLAVAPSKRSSDVSAAAIDWAKAVLDRDLESRPHACALASVVVGKFGAENETSYLRGIMDRVPVQERSPLRLQIACILFGQGRLPLRAPNRMGVGGSR